jgi:hypothetical protein
MSGGAGDDHLRPHPTQVPEHQNIAKKFEIAGGSDDYLFAFGSSDYCDFNIRNKEKGSVVVFSGLRAALRYSEIPVVFFTCYDVGPNETLGVFVRHVVCCVADRSQSAVFFFDMRDLRQISDVMKRTLEREFSKLAGKPMELINSACLERKKCVYLQRFKGEKEMGWCIGWALFFLDHIVKTTTFARMTKDNRKKHIAALYRDIDHQLATPKSNHFIEAYYIQLMGF